MKLIRVAAGVLNQTPLDWPGNLRRVRAAIGAARRREVALLCLPELCLSGYGCEDEFLSPGVQRLSWELLEELLPESRGMVVSLGLPVAHNGAVYNAAALLADGQLLGLVAKQFLAGDGIHYEPRWFKPWPGGLAVELERGGRRVPLGDLVFELDRVRIGFEICEDAWVADRPGSELASRGVDLILNPSASHFAFGKQDIRERLVLEGSRAFGVGYVYANALGNEAGRVIYDGGTLIASAGRLLAAGRRFAYTETELCTAVLDIDQGRLARASSAGFQPALQPPERCCVRHAWSWPDCEPEPANDEREPWERGEWTKHEEFTRAVALGLFDYLRKSRSRGFVVSLSGGVDSASVATLVACMAELALAELGPEALGQRLGLGPLDDSSTPAGLVSRLLTTVYQATRNSSQETREAAAGLARELGAEHHQLELDPLVDGYVELIEAQLGRKLSWEGDDVALQNIQARTRSPGVWLLANLKGALLLACSNRSEAAVGYATMDGDTSGGLSPIAGVDKAFLRDWLRWMERQGPEGLRPLASLAAVNAQQPSAELRPAASCQTDEGDLMPYVLLDRIERAAVRDKRSPLEVLRELRTQPGPWSLEQLAGWVERFFRLWARNQWKRERYAPSFHLDDENLDPRSWCRFPILSGGYERELQDLRDWVASQTRD